VAFIQPSNYGTGGDCIVPTSSTIIQLAQYVKRHGPYRKSSAHAQYFSPRSAQGFARV